MKKLLVYLFVALLSAPLFSQEEKGKGVNFETGTFNDILAKASKNKKSPKLIFMDCYTTWCGPCKFMTSTIFPLEEVGTYMNANFINAKFDMEKGEGLELAKKYKIRAYPTFLILDAQGNEVNRILGSTQTGEEFIKRVKSAMDPQNTPAAKRAKFEADKNPKTAFDYMSALDDAYMMSELEEFAKEYFSTLKPEQKYTPVNWYFISTLIQDAGSENYDNFIKEKSLADKALSREMVDKSLMSILKSYTQKFISGRLKSADTLKVMAKIGDLDKLSVKDAASGYAVQIAGFYRAGNMDGIAKLLNVNEINKYSAQEKSQIESLISSVKGFPADKLAAYFKEKSELLAKQSEESKKQAEKFLK